MNWLTTTQLWTILSDPNLWSGTLREATPLALAAMGGVISERSGVVNIAMEGMMLTGAFFGFVFTLLFSNVAVGLLAAIVTGGIMASFHAFAAIRLRADQIVVGMAVNLVALGLTSFLLFQKYSSNSLTTCLPPTPCTKGQLRTIPDWTVSVFHLDQIPALGSVLFQQNPLVYLMLLIVVLTHFLLFRTTLGLRIRAVGEHPRAADTAGINVQRLRYLSVILSGMLSGLAGGYLSLAVAYGFSDNMTAGRGFIALAAMIFGKWTPFGAFGACLLFGFGSQLGYSLQNVVIGSFQVSPNLISTLPYVVTIVALAGFIGRAIPPAADGLPYDPAEAG
ncbi:MAG: ABC transporter permease [Chloroflexota bacterium]|nr:MAG: ABC transporter permease [Chloroflexota bacterium]